ncbi:hypothetical protein BCR42DRAFT_152411 [Absidia repens]|uniref:Uncharacterized protein n=1 Tax=Absidia repens TaxID=90262 RepID=A0A1X2I293_9FUNG|nr:hypothetical protein BCR42DRAFT_152411 [Absidia repens]
MDKFISAFNRSQPRKDDEGRSHQFVKRLATTASPFISDKTVGQTLSLSELSSIEKDVYSAWWNELDPFGLGIVVDEVMHPFLQASGLAQETLQRIIDFYAGESRYTEDQFYAILRLVAHGQSGRKINRDLVALGGKIKVILYLYVVLNIIFCKFSTSHQF